MSEKRHLNFKLDETASARFDRLMKAATRALGFAPSQAQLVSLALVALEEKYAEEKEEGRTKK
jgi:hypothetical protein